MGWTGAILMMMVAGATVFAGTAIATSHSESADCTGTGFRACVNAKLDLQTMQIHRLNHQVKGLKIIVQTQASQIAALQATDTQQNTDVSTLMATYKCQLGDLLNVTTTLVPNVDGNNVEALILNHHGLVPNWALAFNGCHSTLS
jgi:outer membrane murein-binding lipoprotein Lpp